MEDVANTLTNRFVAFIVTPIVTALAGLGTVAVEGLLDTQLDDAEVASLAVAVSVVVGAQLINWLKNLHDWQKTEETK